uniref:uncharacterized protein si:ch211-214p13.7 n=1 Tax=Scatophagus argus TaxID=75038 RepID=UPI001ED829A5|nr:uncharacterized protein si:ch211-214p13.7 [Scatophagus argus]
MGNCTSGKRKKLEGNSGPDVKSSTDKKPKEDVTYASIDHGTAQGSRRTRATTDDDCDYATVKVPADDCDYATVKIPADDCGYATVKVPADDCGYATVKVPAALRPESECSSKDECEDDYVLMG